MSCVSKWYALKATKTLFLALVVVLAAVVPERVAIAQTCVSPPPGIVAWWGLDEASGNLALDRVGLHHGAYAGVPLAAAGLVRGSLEFNGGSYLAVADSDRWAFGASDFTIELWARFNTPGGGSIGHPSHIFVGNDEGPGTRNKWFFALGGGYLNFHINGPATGSTFLPLVPFSPALGKWYHLAVVRTGATYTIYIDGVPGGSATNSAVVPNPNAPLTIGQAEFLGFMAGRLDEVTIYGRALTQEELRAIVEAAGAGKCQALAIFPARGGNGGYATTSLSGISFAPDAVVRLTGGGHQDIEGTVVNRSPDGSRLDVRFDLMGAAPGIRDVSVFVAGTLRASQASGFEIEGTSATRFSMDVIGLNVVRSLTPQNFWISVTNEGNVDSRTAVALLRIPTGLSIAVTAQPSFFDAYTPEELADSTRVRDLSIAVPSIRAGATVLIPARLTAIEPRTFELRGAVRELTLSGGNGGQDTDLVRYPPRWTNSGPPPPGYYVFFCWKTNTPGNCIDSVGWSLGDGNVVHWLPSPDPNRDGLNVHPWDDPRGKVQEIWRPPNWTVDKAQARVDDFKSKNVPLGSDTYDGKPTSYKKNGVFPDGNCWQGASFFWPELLNLPEDPDLDWGVQYITDLAKEKLAYYWDSRRQPADSEPTVVSTPFPPFWDSLLNGLKQILTLFSFDPNAKIGPNGIAGARYVSAGAAATYSVLFENVRTATAPVQHLLVTDQLDPALFDLTTVKFGPVAFGNRHLIPPIGAESIFDTVDLRPDSNLIVRIAASLNPTTGVITWRLWALDPDTGEPPADPRVGFLPPNVNAPEGDGSVVFTVKPRSELLTGAQLVNRASIFFDNNPAIQTDWWTNTLDADPPRSRMTNLPTTVNATRFGVGWSGSDVGSGIGGYTIYVATNGGPFVPMVKDSLATSGTFSGGEFGNTYAFASVARDQVGNIEAWSQTAHTVTKLVRLAGDIDGDGDVDTNDLNLILAALNKAATGPNDLRDLNGDGKIDALDSRKLVTLCTRLRCAVQ